MKAYTQNISLSLASLDQRHIRLVLAFITLTLLVLGAGAPTVAGEAGG